MSNRILTGIGFQVIAVLLVSCSGVEKRYFEDGTLKSEIAKRNGHFHGKATWYYSNGIKQHECFFINDTLQGTSTRWYNTGKLHSVEQYQDNRLHGTVITYDPDGKKVSEQHYHLDTLHGPYREFYTSGQARVEGNYDKGYYEGRWIYFEEDGTIIGMGEFHRGTGKQRGWYRDGTLKREVGYLSNEKHGRETWYTPDGRVERVLKYEYGELVSDEELNR